MNVPYKIVMGKDQLGGGSTGWLCMLDVQNELADAVIARYPKVGTILGSGKTQDEAAADFFRQCDEIANESEANPNV
jgi:hypothetical protein